MYRKLLQNAQKFCYKMCVVTKCAEILLQNAHCHKMRRNFITKCTLIQNAQKFCDKMRALLHNAQSLQNRLNKASLEVFPLFERRHTTIMAEYQRCLYGKPKSNLTWLTAIEFLRAVLSPYIALK